MSNTPIKKMNRREFLAYMMAGSVGVLGLQATGVAVWFALPDYDAENTYILKSVPMNLQLDMPSKIVANDSSRKFRFWLSYTQQGLVAFSIHCPFKEMIEYSWVERPDRFICPDCGSKFTKEGIHVYGPSTRHLDRYPLKIVTANQVLESDDLGNPLMVPLKEIQEVHVNVGRLIRGKVSYLSQ